MLDQYTTTMAKSQMFGVEIHANIIQAFLDNELYSHASGNTAMLVVAFIAMLGYLLFDWLRARLGAVILVLLIIGYSGFVYCIYQAYGLLLPYFYTLLGLIIAYVTSVIAQYLKERKKGKEQNNRYFRQVCF
ncbi:MAG: hypothetical protein GX434_14075 [Peptococcaceae bacterium]|nr:hypothetical protein [Peptococcaceae bacterium]